MLAISGFTGVATVIVVVAIFFLVHVVQLHDMLPKVVYVLVGLVDATPEQYERRHEKIQLRGAGELQQK